MVKFSALTKTKLLCQALHFKFTIWPRYSFENKCPLFPPVIVWTNQRAGSCKSWHINVVLDDHDISHFVGVVEGASSIGQDDRFHTHHLENAHWQRDLEIHAVTVTS